MLGTILNFNESDCCLLITILSEIYNITFYFKGGDSSFSEELMDFPTLSHTFHATIITGLTQV